MFDFVWKLLFDLSFRASQHKRPDDLMQAVYNQELLLLGEVLRVGVPPLPAKGRGKPVVKRVAAVKHFGQHKVQEGPQFVQ